MKLPKVRENRNSNFSNNRDPEKDTNICTPVHMVLKVLYVYKCEMNSVFILLETDISTYTLFLFISVTQVKVGKHFNETIQKN